MSSNEEDLPTVDQEMRSSSSRSLVGQSAIVTGASRGIGRAIALALAGEGANVVISYHSQSQRADEVVSAIRAEGGKALAVEGDLAVEATVLDVFDQAERNFGGVDIVVANAADALVKPLVDCTEADFDTLMAANLKSAFFTLREAARRVSDGGRIIATSTGGTRMFFTETSLYLASKGAVEQIVRALSRELGPRGIAVNAISPGFTNTDLLPDRDRKVAAEASPFERIGEPGDIADAVTFLAGAGGRWITGQNISISGGVC